VSEQAADKILDVAWREAYLTLPPRVQALLETGDPRAEKRLRAAYTRIKTNSPNRATRRAKRKRNP
jgi:hypothetical protein